MNIAWLDNNIIIKTWNCFNQTLMTNHTNTWSISGDFIYVNEKKKKKKTLNCVKEKVLPIQAANLVNFMKSNTYLKKKKKVTN